jgi:hypothetical protein
VRVIKLAIISFIIVFLIITAFSLMIPSDIRLSKAINIIGPVDSVLGRIKDRSQWPQWHPVYQQAALRDQWERMNTKILQDTDSTYVLQYQQQDRMPVISGWQVYEYANRDSVTLQWYMDFTLSWYPWQKFSSLFYEKNYGVMMETGLSNFKKTYNK